MQFGNIERTDAFKRARALSREVQDPVDQDLLIKFANKLCGATKTLPEYTPSDVLIKALALHKNEAFAFQLLRGLVYPAGLYAKIEAAVKTNSLTREHLERVFAVAEAGGKDQKLQRILTIMVWFLENEISALSFDQVKFKIKDYLGLISAADLVVEVPPGGFSVVTPFMLMDSSVGDAADIKVDRAY